MLCSRDAVADRAPHAAKTARVTSTTPTNPAPTRSTRIPQRRLLPSQVTSSSTHRSLRAPRSATHPSTRERGGLPHPPSKPKIHRHRHRHRRPTPPRPHHPPPPTPHHTTPHHAACRSRLRTSTPADPFQHPCDIPPRQATFKVRARWYTHTFHRSRFDSSPPNLEPTPNGVTIHANRQPQRRQLYRRPRPKPLRPPTVST